MHSRRRSPRQSSPPALLQSVPRLDWDKSEKLVPIEGHPPDLLRRPPGCAFHPRCTWAVSACHETWPELMQVEDQHWAACDVMPAT